MKNNRNILLAVIAVVLIALASMSTAPGSAPKGVRDGDSKYRVFCADNKVEVEQRTMEQEKSARGSNVCMMAEFDYASDADKYAENHGGKGSACSCQ